MPLCPTYFGWRTKVSLMDTNKLAKLTTESVNPQSIEIDRWHPLEIVRLMNREDQQVIQAVARAELQIARTVELVEDAFRTGGRLIYMGAGTSGRLGVLDASECPPTFSTPPEMVVGFIAGGDTALRRAIEGAEDSPELGASDLAQLNLNPRDVVVGIATSGRTPYVMGGMSYARSVGAHTVAVVCNAGSEMEALCDVVICAIVGPEIVSGSTRLKAGTATKLILNSITTAAMIRIGKTYGNLMVDVRATNKKLIARSRRLVRMLTGLSDAAADELLARADGIVKVAIVMHHRQTDAHMATQLLELEGGHLRKVIGDVPVQALSSP
ncbi:MAG: N-acetylmuramic acid 6-phosphate etherase [Pirellulaceae bacterium]|nr:N-acetylmuramic acid 6-phosphate etherase [Pirellulaceae bacterium]